MKLSKNFNSSEIFGAHKPTDMQLNTAYRLVTCLIQPIRTKINKPLSIGDGIRLPSAGYGSSTSEHFWRDFDGAVDVSIYDHQERLNIMQWLMNDFRYSVGQCIYYLETSHLHISLAGRKQSEFMVCVSKKKDIYRNVTCADDVIKLDKRLQDVS